MVVLMLPLLLTFNPKDWGDFRFVAAVVTQNIAFGVGCDIFIFPDHKTSKVTVCVSCEELYCVDCIFFFAQNLCLFSLKWPYVKNILSHLFYYLSVTLFKRYQCYKPSKNIKNHMGSKLTPIRWLRSRKHFGQRKVKSRYAIEAFIS